MTEVKGYGSASDVVNVNQQNTDNFLKQMSGYLGQISGSATDPMGAFMQALPGLFGQALGANSQYAQKAQSYADMIAPKAVTAAMNPYSAENALYSSGAAGAAGEAAATVQAGASKDIVGMMTSLFGQLAGGGAGILQAQQGLFGSMLNTQGQLSAPEWWQPTYMETNTGFGDLMGVLGGVAGTALGLGGMGLFGGGGGSLGSGGIGPHGLGYGLSYGGLGRGPWA